MKFLALAALIATAQAAVGADCAEDASVCEESECCGTATPDAENESTAEEPIQVCQTDTETEYINAEDEEQTYTFACNAAEGDDAAAAGDMATKIAATGAALLVAVNLMWWHLI